MGPLLFLTHRIPFPPNKGDKVRSYHFLRHLAERHRVFLATFVDDRADLEHVDQVRAMCADACIARLHPPVARVASAVGLLTREALTPHYYRSRRLQAWIAAVVERHRIGQAVVFSSAMAQYVLPYRGMRRVVDFVDVDSTKWTEYAARRRWPLSAIYAREGRRLLGFERTVAAQADASLFVTPAEATLFGRLAPEAAGKICVVGNGVDATFFAPAGAHRSPYGRDEQAIVFTGAMDYWPNTDAVAWFLREVFPMVRGAHPAARFYIVGMNPSPAVRALAVPGAVVVTGRVPDVRPYLQHARAVVVPLRVARGIQNKILEAMAMECAVVVSESCVPSLAARVGDEIEAAASATAFAEKVIGLIGSERRKELGRAARARVLAEYTWEENLRPLDALLGGTESPAHDTAFHTSAPRHGPGTSPGERFAKAG